MPKPRFTQVWSALSETYGQPHDGGKCPSCKQTMALAQVPGDEGSVEIDYCGGCRFIWLDAQEQEAIGGEVPEEEPARELAPEARELLGRAESESIERRERAGRFGSEPAVPWQATAARFGLPFEANAPEVVRNPVVTWAVFSILVVTTLAGWQWPGLRDTFGLMPNEPLRLGGLNWLTYAFMPSGFLVSALGIYFLALFGDNVEDAVGPMRMALLLVVGALGAGATHVLADPDAGLSLTGSGGAISGILAYYVLRFPKARLGLFSALYFPGIFITARAAFVLWLGLQLLPIFAQLVGAAGVSGIAHIGGAATGALLWMIWDGCGPR
jgi:membrane associated rhomboid family serine protease/Zn-finger nucleic acid-binding protein